jgi:predicted methyltransferase
VADTSRPADDRKFDVDRKPAEVLAYAEAKPRRGNVSLDLAPPGEFHLVGKVDLFRITNNHHDLHIPNYANVDMAVLNKQVFYPSIRWKTDQFILKFVRP